MKSKNLQRWIVQLQQFDFVARYLPGKDNYIADYLSRDSPSSLLQALPCEMLVIQVLCRSTASTAAPSPNVVELLWSDVQCTRSRATSNWNHIHRISSRSGAAGRLYGDQIRPTEGVTSAGDSKRHCRKTNCAV